MKGKIFCAFFKAKLGTLQRTSERTSAHTHIRKSKNDRRIEVRDRESGREGRNRRDKEKIFSSSNHQINHPQWHSLSVWLTWQWMIWRTGITLCGFNSTSAEPSEGEREMIRLVVAHTEANSHPATPVSYFAVSGAHPFWAFRKLGRLFDIRFESNRWFIRHSTGKISFSVISEWAVMDVSVDCGSSHT